MQRSRAMDCLRGVAILLVMFRHFPPCPAETCHFLNTVMVPINRGGWVGVDLFFVLSGFLVSGLLFSEFHLTGRLSAKNFLIRRGFKIYPAFWVLVLVTLIAVAFQRKFALIPGRPVTFENLIIELSFLQNYFTGLPLVTWSLAVEEHFYLLLVVFFMAITRKNRRGEADKNGLALIPPVFLVVALACLSARVVTANLLPFDYKPHVFSTHLRMDSLFAGVFIAYFFHLHNDVFTKFARRFRWPLLLLGIAGLLPVFVLNIEESPFLYTYGFSLVYLAGGCLLVAGLAVQIPGVLKGLALIGSYSYTIFLWHCPMKDWGLHIIKKFGINAVSGNWFVSFGFYFLGAIVLGILMSKVVELPLLSIRNRHFPSRAKPLVS